MRVLLCSLSFPSSRDVLAPLLPDDEIARCEVSEVAREAATADVLIPMMSRLDHDIIAHTPARMIQQWGAGLEGVDVAAASARGIFVCNVPSDATPNAESTAEHALFLMLGVARRIRTCQQAFRSGMWGGPMGDALFGRRALIVGFGRIGKALARRLVAMGMTVDAVRRFPEPGEAAREGVASVGTTADLPRLAGDADFVVSTATVTADSRGLLGRSLFARMKPTAVVVNVSRGPVVDEAALEDALRRGRIAGAGLDVFEREPVDPGHPLLAMENVFATPHVAGVTRQSYEGIARAIADNVERLKAGQPPMYCVNLDAVRG